MAETTLHLSSFDLPPRRTVSLAAMRLHPQGLAGFFEPWAGPDFATEDIALCGRAEDHDAPGAECDCGFRAADDPQSLLDLINPPLEALAGAALLDVELGGIVLPLGPGFRGSSQRVLGAKVLRWCRGCLRSDQVARSTVELHAEERSGWLRVVGLCEEHAGRRPHALAVTPAEVADFLRTPVAWADPQLAAAVLLQLERRYASPQLVGPLAAERRVASLRMGTWDLFLRLPSASTAVGCCASTYRRRLRSDRTVAQSSRSAALWSSTLSSSPQRRKCTASMRGSPGRGRHCSAFGRSTSNACGGCATSPPR